MQPEHYVNELREVIARVRQLLQGCIEACPPPGGPPEKEARCEGAFVALRAVMEELDPMLRAWEAGHPAWRSTELMLEGREAEIAEMIREVANAEPPCSG